MDETLARAVRHKKARWLRAGSERVEKTVNGGVELVGYLEVTLFTITPLRMRRLIFSIHAR